MESQQDFKKNIFEAININEIVWVDDRFSKTSDTLKDEYISEVTSLHENGEIERLTIFPPFSEIDWELPFEVIKDEHLPNDDPTITAFYQHLKKGVPDLSTSQFEALIAIFKDATQSILNLSHADWLNQKDTILKKNGIKLFLIDLNFEKEGLAPNHGESIVCELINSNLDDCYFVLFTSETNFGDEEEKARNEVVGKLAAGTDHHNFSVLSKKIVEIDNDDISLEFKSAEFLKRIFLRKLSAEMLLAVSEIINTSLEGFQSDLSQNSIYEVDTSIFNNSLNEGGSEFDLLYRLFSIKQKETMSDCLMKNPKLIQKLKDFRSVQMSSQSAEQKKYIKKSMLTAPNFISLRNTEMFDSLINLIHAPLSAGDIFSFQVDDDEKIYILIDQPCDLSVRGSTGMRKTEEVLLVPFETKVFNETKKSVDSYEKSMKEPKYYLLKIATIDSGKTYYRFDFSKSITVNSHLLDLAIYNKKGNLYFDVGQNDHDLLFLPGWLKRYDDFKKNVMESSTSLKTELPIPYKVFSLLYNDKFPVSISNTSISISGKRVRRLRSPFINELMSAYYVSYKDRTALEMDFS